MAYRTAHYVPRIPVVARIAHSAAFIPADIRDQFIVDDDELRVELSKSTDWYTDELLEPVRADGGCIVRHEVSRFVVDPERAPDDAQEPMARMGWGVIHERGHGGTLIRRPLSNTERDHLLERYYFPFHSRLCEAIERAIETFGRCTVVDCHSCSNECAVACPALENDITLGIDSIHTRPELTNRVEELVKAHGWTFGAVPIWGRGCVPGSYYGDGRVSGFTIRVRRSLYMDQAGLSKDERFYAVRELMADLTALSCEW